MKLVQFIDPSDGMRLGLVIGDEVLDLTDTEQGLRTVHQLYYDGGGDEIGLVAATQNLQKRAARRLSLDALLANRSIQRPVPHQASQRSARPSPRLARVAGRSHPRGQRQVA